MQKINLDTLTSDAIREQEEKVPGLKASLSGMEQGLCNATAKWTKQQFMDDFDMVSPGYTKKHRLTGKESRDNLADHYIRANRESTESHAQINAMEWAAHADQEMAKKVNALIDAAADARQDLIDALTGSTDVGRIMQWKGDTAAIAGAAAKWASKVASGVEAGKDIRRVTEGVFSEAVQDIVSFPRQAEVSGFSGVRRAENLWEARGAGEFARRVSEAYGFSPNGIGMMVPVAYLR